VSGIRRGLLLGSSVARGQGVQSFMWFESHSMYILCGKELNIMIRYAMCTEAKWNHKANAVMLGLCGSLQVKVPEERRDGTSGCGWCKRGMYMVVIGVVLVGYVCF
jgi:hypothetical protein